MRGLVWMIVERVRAELVWQGAFASRVRYTWKGIDYDVIVNNDDYEDWEEHVSDRR